MVFTLMTYVRFSGVIYKVEQIRCTAYVSDRQAPASSLMYRTEAGKVKYACAGLLEDNCSSTWIERVSESGIQCMRLTLN